MHYTVHPINGAVLRWDYNIWRRVGMVGTKLFLEKAKLIEMIALEFGINKNDVHQNKRNSLKAVNEKAFDDYHKLMRRIAYFVCHAEEKYNRCNCDECTTLIEVLSGHGNRCLSLYDFITKQNTHSLVHQSVVNTAILDFFILPYLRRVVSELKAKFEDNRILFYLNSYIKFLIVEAPRSESLLRIFLKEHVASVPYGLYVDKTRYRVKIKTNKSEYQPWDSFVEEARNEGMYVSKGKRVLSDDKKFLLPGDTKRSEAFGWHCAGNVVYQLLKLVCPSGHTQAMPWRENKAFIGLRKRKYDFIYNSFLSLNQDMRFSLLRSDEILFNLKIDNNLELYLSLDKDMQACLPLDKVPQYGISVDESVQFKLSFNDENLQYKIPRPRNARFNYTSNQATKLNLRFDETVRTRRSSDNEAQFNISLRDDAKINFVFDKDSQFKLFFDNDAKFDLRPNKYTEVDANFENVREYRYKEIFNIINAFDKAINSSMHIDATEIGEFDAFCKKALNGMPTMDDVKKSEGKLKALLKGGRTGRYFSFIAWCIFIAKCKHGKFNAGNEIQYCGYKVAEHQDDYIALWRRSEIIKKLKQQAAYVDLKNDALSRLTYIRVYNMFVTGCFEKTRPRPVDKLLIINWRPISFFPSTDPKMLSFLSGYKCSGEIIHPFVEIEKYIDSLLKWDNCASSKVSINELKMKNLRKEYFDSLSWLVIPNSVESQKNKKIEMKLCLTCAVKIYPNLMALAGLGVSPKYASLYEPSVGLGRTNPRLDQLLSRLGSCRCQEINELELKENLEAKDPFILP